MTADTTVKSLLALYLSLVFMSVEAEIIYLQTSSIAGALPIRSWKAKRDEHIVKQAFDHSCGAASMATLLGFYGVTWSEKALMNMLGEEGQMASFNDMANVLKQLGFMAEGLALSFEQLTRLQIPAIAYLRPERGDHFTVIRGISASHVWIGDPAWGNRVLTRARFLKMWSTRDNKKLVGKILLIQPRNRSPLVEGAFGMPEKKHHPLLLKR